MARRPPHTSQHEAHPLDDQASGWERRLELIIAIALGLAALVTAGAVYLNEQQEHKATKEFHSATHYLVSAASAGLRTPLGHSLEAKSEDATFKAEDHQEKATDYTLAEVILATSLFLFGIAGISSQMRIKIGALTSASIVFFVALVILATV